MYVWVKIQCNVEVRMSGTIANHTILQEYENLAKELYVEPENEEILGFFLHLIMKDLSGAGGKKRNTPAGNKSTTRTTVKCANLRVLFKACKNEQQKRR